MTISQRLRTLLVCSMLEVAALTGAPMRPDEIQELMYWMNLPKIARTTPDESDRADGDPEPKA